MVTASECQLRLAQLFKKSGFSEVDLTRKEPVCRTKHVWTCTHWMLFKGGATILYYILLNSAIFYYVVLYYTVLYYMLSYILFYSTISYFSICYGSILENT